MLSDSRPFPGAAGSRWCVVCVAGVGGGCAGPFCAAHVSVASRLRGGGGGWVGTGPHRSGMLRPVCPPLCSTGPNSWRSGSKAERTGTAPVHIRTCSHHCCQCLCAST